MQLLGRKIEGTIAKEWGVASTNCRRVRGKVSLQEPLERTQHAGWHNFSFSTARLISDFYTLVLYDNKFVLKPQNVW